MADYINNLAALDTYSNPLTLGPDFSARTVVITIANNPALMQFAVGKVGNWRWTDEREYFSIPQSFKVGNVIGVKFRNANAGQTARILATLSGPDDIDFESGIPFTGQLSASGTLSGQTLTSAALTNAITQSILNNSQTAVTLGSVVWDTNGFASGSTLVVPTGLGGDYLVTASGLWLPNTFAGNRSLILLRNASLLDQADNPGVIGGNTGQSLTVPVVLAAGDILSASVFQTSGAACTLNNCWLTASKVG